jgi:nitroreductase
MNILKLIQKRRSIRKYRNRSVADELIAKILEAGRWAPSGLNNQPWRFLVIHNPGQKDKLARFTKYGHIIKKAAAVILVFIDKRVMYNRDKDLMAIGACIQNMLLEAQSLGLGACWLGEILNRKKEVSGNLQVPADLELMAVLSLGYSAEKTLKGKRQSLKSMVLVLKRSDHAQRNN